MIPAKYWSPTKKLMVLGAMAGAGALVEDTATGNPLTFITDKAKPLKRLALSLLPRQSGSGDPSPSNIRPLLPWGEVGTWTGGKNLLNPVAENSIPFTNTNYNKYTLTDGVVVTSGNTLFGFKVKVKPNTVYRFEYEMSETVTMEIFAYTEEPSVITNQDRQIINNTSPTWQFTTFDDTEWISCGIYTTKSGVTIKDFSLTVGAEQTAYTPYTPITPHPVNLENITPPVYGCELDLTTGEVWGTYGSDDLGSLDYSEVSSAGVSAFRSNIGAVNVSDYKQHGITSVYPFAGTRFIANMPDKSWMIDAFGRLFVRDDSYSDTATLKTALIGQRIAYELATPVLLATLTPQQVNALVGVNTVWSDADGVEVTYLKKG